MIGVALNAGAGWVFVGCRIYSDGCCFVLWGWLFRLLVVDAAVSGVFMVEICLSFGVFAC